MDLEFAIRPSLFLGAALTVGACAEGPVATLVPIRCGVGSLGAIRVETRGDVPTGRSASEIVGAEVKSLSPLPEGTRGITVEGLFGNQVEAVGRTAALVSEGDMPVYFAPPDSLCGFEMPIWGIEPGAVDLSSAGHGLSVGGRGVQGELLAEVVYFADTSAEVTRAAVRMPMPIVGHSLHAVGPTRFVALGGATSVGTLATAEPLEIVKPGVIELGPSIPLIYGERLLEGRAFHGAERLPDGRILMTGGCSQAAGGVCVPSPDTVLAGSWVLDPSKTRLDPRPGPALGQPRYGHTLLVGSDGAAFAVGGFDAFGSPVHRVELLLSGGEAWTNYGPSLSDLVEEGDVVLGGTLLEGGIVVLALSNGQVVWINEHHRATLEAWCTGVGACTDAIVDDLAPIVPRSLQTLPDERVLFDRYVIHPALLNLTGADAIDLTLPRWEGDLGRVAPRVGALTLGLRDGSVFVAGGVDLSGGLATPWLIRFRPVLDGPDERIPDIGTLEPASLVLHDPGREGNPRIVSSGATLRMTADESVADDVLSTWVHVRSFRSRSFRFEAVLTTQAAARPWLVFSTGAIARVEIRFERSEIRYVQRFADGSAVSVVCDAVGADFSAVGERLRADVSEDGIEIYLDDRVILCPGLPGSQAAVGLGVVGQGSLVVQGLRLAR